MYSNVFITPASRRGYMKTMVFGLTCADTLHDLYFTVSYARTLRGHLTSNKSLVSIATDCRADTSRTQSLFNSYFLSRADTFWRGHSAITSAAADTRGHFADT